MTRAWLLLVAACGGGGTAPDAELHDAGRPDAVAADDLGPVQCRVTDDCFPLTGSGCFAARPGGVCDSCSDEGDSCPEGTVCITGGTSGASECAFPCETDDDCNLGMYCVTDGAIAGHCQPRRCGDGFPDCPAPYTFCRETTAPLYECSRPRCEDGCPPPLYCPADGAFCIEPD
jgi:hypothetical protein